MTSASAGSPKGRDTVGGSFGEADDIAVGLQANAQTTDNPIDLRLAYARIREALDIAAQQFEAVRKLLVKDLDEPGRSAFWAAVRGRDAAREALTKADHIIGLSAGNDLSERVRRLVIAARHVAYTSAPDDRDASKELDQAVEAFASDIPWENGDGA